MRAEGLQKCRADKFKNYRTVGLLECRTVERRTVERRTVGLNCKFSQSIKRLRFNSELENSTKYFKS